MLEAVGVTRTTLAPVVPAQQVCCQQYKKGVQIVSLEGTPSSPETKVAAAAPWVAVKAGRAPLDRGNGERGPLAESPRLRNDGPDVGSQELRCQRLQANGCELLPWPGAWGRDGGGGGLQGLSLYLRVLFIHLLPAGFREKLCAAARQTVLIQNAFRVRD
jgi:hypothetical protein